MPLRRSAPAREFFAMFAEAAQNVADCADIVAGLLDPNANREAIARQLDEREHQGDSITDRIIRLSHGRMPARLDRSDVERVAVTLDDVVDALETTANFIVLADVGTLPQLIGEQITLLATAAHESADALDRLAATPVGAADLELYWIEVSRLESEADRVYRRVLSRLFSGDYDALTMAKLREVADGFERATNALEQVADAVETLAARRS